MRVWPWLLGAGGAVVIAIAASGDDTPDATTKPKPRRRGGWADPDAPRRIRKLAAPIERAFGWPGLGDFLVAVAWTESRGNSSIVNKQEPNNPNAARGWFQIRPNSANNAAVRVNPDILFDERAAVALAADYANRMIGRWRREVGEGSPDWLAIRRGWAAPVLVKDREERMPFRGMPPGKRSADTRERFAEALYAAGIPESFMYETAEPPGFVWGGQANALRLTGYPMPSA